MKHNKCLLCYQPVEENKEEFHKACSRKLFSSVRPPPIASTLGEIEGLAREHATNRIAVAGVQPKLSIDLKPPKSKRGVAHQRLKELPRLAVGIHGQYLLKTPTKKYPNMVELEDLTMHLAQLCKIKTAAHGLIRLGSGELAYITRRFDREGTQKLPQEDFCQLSELLTEYKYNSSMEKVGNLVREHSMNSGLDAIVFLETAIFCFLTGNADMHTKNFSILTRSDGTRMLSPAYDLLATTFLVPKDKEESALPINEKKAELKREDFVALGKSLKIPAIAIEKCIGRFALHRIAMESLIDQSFISKELKLSYKKLIETRAARLRSS